MDGRGGMMRRSMVDDGGGTAAAPPPPPPIPAAADVQEEVVLDVEIRSASSSNPSSTTHAPVRKPSFFRSPFPSAARLTKQQNLKLAYQSIGVVYAGIGTCPLYVFSSFQLKNPTEEDYLGVFSIVFWTFTLISFIKYGFIILRADDHGEGGTFALYSILCQHANISRFGRVPKKAVKVAPKDGSVQAKTIKHMEKSVMTQLALFIFTMIGVCMLIGDGIITPAISVLSAVDGLRNASTVFNTTSIVIITTLLLIALFMLQRFGTSKVGFLFSPIVVVWFVAIALIGVYNVVMNNPSVFKALSPHYMFTFFINRKKEGWLALAGTVLCITSSEAMYADLGHFNRISMQMGFAFICYPSCILAYAGQTAYLTKYLDNTGIFYNSIPTPVYWPMFIVATLAAIIASQCLISACFSLVKQSVALDLFPKVRLIHTSENHEGQIYSPEVNYFLMILCVCVVLGMRSVDSLGHAYGVTVIMVMLLTTIVASLAMVVVWNVHISLVLIFLVVYGTIEGVYISSVMTKVPEGGWLPFVVAIFIGMIMFTWVYGRDKHHKYEKANMVRVQDVRSLLATSKCGVARVPGLCVFFCDFDDEVPPLMRHYLHNIRSLHKIVIFTTVNFCKVPKVPPRERYRFSEGDSSGLYRCMAFYGYAEERKIVWSEFRECMIEALRDYMCLKDNLNIENGAPSDDESFFREEDLSPPHEGLLNSQLSSNDDLPAVPSLSTHFTSLSNGKLSSNNAQPRTSKDLETLESVRTLDPVLVIGKARLVSIRKGFKFWLERVFLDVIYRFLYSNSTSPATYFILSVPPTNLVEVSMHYQV